jgi:putative tricarboxylic transport membrane protein
MRIKDTLAGVLLILLGVACILQARSFPPSPGQKIGPDLFPSLMGGGLAVCGLIFIASAGWRGRAWVQLDDWVRRPRMVFNGLLVISVLIAYALLVDTMGFFLTAFAFLSVLFLAFGVRRRWIPLLSAVVTFAMHFVFYTMLRVPLPWGWLERLAW